MGGAFQNSYMGHVTSDTSRALMWCTCVTLEIVKKRHKQGDPLPPTDSLCFDSASFFPSYIHHLMYGTLLGGRRAMRRTCLLWFWTGNVGSESELHHFHPPSSGGLHPGGSLTEAPAVALKPDVAEVQHHNALPFLVVASLANYQHQLPQSSNPEMCCLTLSVFMKMIHPLASRNTFFLLVSSVEERQFGRQRKSFHTGSTHMRISYK